MLTGFEQELHYWGVNRVLIIPGKRLQDYICYFSRNQVVKLTKTMKDDLKAILYPLLYQHFKLLVSTLELVSGMTAMNTASTSVQAGNNALTDMDACDGHEC